MDSIKENLNIPSIGPFEVWVTMFVREMIRAWLEMAQKVNNGLCKVYIQNAEPTIPNNTMGLWFDADASKYYLLARTDDVQKKVELT